MMDKLEAGLVCTGLGVFNFAKIALNYICSEMERQKRSEKFFNSVYLMVPKLTEWITSSRLLFSYELFLMNAIFFRAQAKILRANETDGLQSICFGEILSRQRVVAMTGESILAISWVNNWVDNIVKQLTSSFYHEYSIRAWSLGSW